MYRYGDRAKRYVVEEIDEKEEKDVGDPSVKGNRSFGKQRKSPMLETRPDMRRRREESRKEKLCECYKWACKDGVSM